MYVCIYICIYIYIYQEGEGIKLTRTPNLQKQVMLKVRLNDKAVVRTIRGKTHKNIGLLCAA